MSNWWVFDNHTFRRLSDDAEEAVIEAMALQDDDSYGSFGVKREGEPSYMIHGSGDANEFRRGMLAWLYDKQSDRLRSRNEQLEAGLRILYAAAQDESGANGWITMPNEMNEAREALSAEREQGEPAVCPACGELSRMHGHGDSEPAPTPDGGEGALGALDRLRFAAVNLNEQLPLHEAAPLVDAIRRSLREPRVPEAVRRLPDEIRASGDADDADTYREGLEDAAVIIECFIAQHGGVYD